MRAHLLQRLQGPQCPACTFLHYLILITPFSQKPDQAVCPCVRNYCKPPFSQKPDQAVCHACAADAAAAGAVG